MLAAGTLSARASASLSQSVYIWQRAWTPPVVAAVSAHATNFAETVVLAAEVSWKNQLPSVTRVAVDYPTLAKVHPPIGLALRVGPYHGDLAKNSLAVNVLAGVAASTLTAALTNLVTPVELQIDFDCATARLADYRVWLTELQHRLAPLPVTITALPAWLDSPAFAPLAATASNYVLQVHSLEKPVSLDQPFTLCDPVAARRAVSRAGELGVPFRVALPTYTYLVAFGTNGRFAGLSAEVPKTDWPAGTQVRAMSADPVALSALMQDWTTNRPAALRGVIWYRLPVNVDNLNWRWATLGAIVQGRVPREQFHAAARRVEPGLVEISLVNSGELDISSRLAVMVRWSGARLAAGDGLAGFELAEPDGAAASLNSPLSFRLPAGEKLVIGWLRFDADREVHLEVRPF